MDPVTCEGISNAILSGRLAAEAIAAHRDRPDRVHRSYHRALRAQILSDLRLARLLALLLYQFPRLRRSVFRRAGAPICRAVGEVVAGRTDYRGLLAHPRSYLKLFRLLLTA